MLSENSFTKLERTIESVDPVKIDTKLKYIQRETGRARIVVIFPRGETIRNFVYTGTLKQLNDACDVHLLTVDLGPEFEILFRNSSEQIHSLREVPDRWIVRIQRELLETAHNRWLWSRAAKERSRLRDHEAKSFRERMIRRVKKIVCFPLANRKGLDLLSRLERSSSRIFSTANEYLDLYREIKPALVFNSSHVHSRNATQAVQAAQWLGIPTATFIFSWDNLTSQGRIMLPYDYFIVWNEDLKQHLLEMYEWIKPENVFVTGTPQFDMHFRKENYLNRDDYCKHVGADPARPIVLYTTGMANHMPGEPEIVEEIANILNKFPKENRPQLLVRVYAKDLTGRFDELRKRRFDILFADPIWEPEWLTPKKGDSIALTNALRHSELGINVASTISLELCMFDKPVINVGYNPPSVSTEELSYADYYEFDHYKPLVESGAVQVAHSADEMSSLIEDALNLPELGSVERKALIDRMFGGTLDGNSGHRSAKVLTKLAQGND